MTQKTKQITISVVVIIIAFVGFKAFFSGVGSGDMTLLSDQPSLPQFVDGQTILVLLNNLNKVTLDNSVFSDKVFTSLVDFERSIADQAIGRKNPFLPIGVEDSGTIVPKGTSTVQTR